jgi:pimeloyl-ACP methyl ester carboxylesterase
VQRRRAEKACNAGHKLIAETTKGHAVSTATDFLQPTLVRVNGVELEVFEAGRENAGNPIVLCHGWPELAYSWRHQVPALVAAGYHVIVPNQRGYGNSSAPDEVTAYDIEQLAGDLVGLLDHYRYREAIFVGHDWGAAVVWGLTLLHPGRVSRVINLSLPYQERCGAGRERLPLPAQSLPQEPAAPGARAGHGHDQPGQGRGAAWRAGDVR